MTTRSWGYSFAALMTLFLFCEPITLAQNGPGIADVVPLTVAAGVPLHVALDKAVPVKNPGAAVEGRLLDPIYVFDHLVIPAGSQVVGRVAQVDQVSGKQRALAIANGDFTPLRTPHVDFDTLVLKDGTRIPLNVSVSQGSPPVVHLIAGGKKKKKKSRVSTAVGQARQEAKTREHQAIEEVKAPGKWQRFKALISAELPYHRQSLPVGTQFTAELRAPLRLGEETPSSKELVQLGGKIPPGSLVHVRLLTPLSSATTHRGSQVQAVVSQPVFSAKNLLILPEGTRLEGTVTEAVPARRLGRNGKLRFMFRQIKLPAGAPHRVEATLQGVESASGARLKLDAEGGAHAVTPKTNYIAPAIDVVLAAGSLDGLDPHRRLHPGFTQGPDVAGGAVRGGAGFGLIGSLIGLAARYRPVSAVFAFYGAGWSVYSHIVARGTNVVFSKDTPMEILFGTHEGPPSPAVKGKTAQAVIPKPAKTS